MAEKERFFSCEKWIHYDNPMRRKSWDKPGHASTSSAKTNIHGFNLFICIWWDQLCVVYYELLKSNETITGNRYRLQLMSLTQALKENRLLWGWRLKLVAARGASERGDTPDSGDVCCIRVSHYISKDI